MFPCYMFVEFIVPLTEFQSSGDGHYYVSSGIGGHRLTMTAFVPLIKAKG